MTRHFDMLKKVQEKGGNMTTVVNVNGELEKAENTVQLWRLRRSDHGTEGMLFTNGFSCMALELPWRENINRYSCIPAGTYNCVKRFSPSRQKNTYWLKNVPNRNWILIHSGNWAGDTKKGFRSDVYGCILLGKTHAIWKSQRLVTNSRITVREFENHMQWEPFTLTIKESF